MPRCIRLTDKVVRNARGAETRFELEEMRFVLGGERDGVRVWGEAARRGLASGMDRLRQLNARRDVLANDYVMGELVSGKVETWRSS